jgi:hypothetical protein
MDAQTKVSQASVNAITFIKESVARDIVEAQRKGVVLPGAGKADLERLILLLNQSIDASFQKQQSTFQRALKTALEEAEKKGWTDATTSAMRTEAGTGRKKG